MAGYYNYKLYRTSPLLGGDMKLDLVVGKDDEFDDVLKINNNTQNCLCIKGFHIRPISKYVPFNYTIDDSDFNNTLQYNIKQFYKKIQGYFYNTNVREDLKGDWQMIVPEDYTVEDRKYEKPFDDTYWAGCSRMSRQLYGTTHEVLVPVWIENAEGIYLIITVETNDATYEGLVSLLDRDYYIGNYEVATRKDKNEKYRNLYTNYKITQMFSDYFEYVRMKEGNSDVISVDFDKKIAYVRGLNVESGEFQTIEDRNLLNSLLDRERPLLEQNKLIADTLSNNHMICSQLLNLNICFDINDFGVDVGEDARVSVRACYKYYKTPGGELGDSEMYNDCDLYTNHEYVPIPSKHWTVQDTFDYFDVDSKNSGLDSGYGQINTNALDHKKDNLSVDLMHANKMVQPICHWVYSSNPHELFNLYNGFYESGNFYKENCDYYQSNPESEYWGPMLYRDANGTALQPTDHDCICLNDCVINGIKFNYKKTEDMKNFPERVYLCLIKKGIKENEEGISSCFYDDICISYYHWDAGKQFYRCQSKNTRETIWKNSNYSHNLGDLEYTMQNGHKYNHLYPSTNIDNIPGAAYDLYVNIEGYIFNYNIIYDIMLKFFTQKYHIFHDAFLYALQSAQFPKYIDRSNTIIDMPNMTLKSPSKEVDLYKYNQPGEYIFKSSGTIRPAIFRQGAKRNTKIFPFPGGSYPNLNHKWWVYYNREGARYTSGQYCEFEVTLPLELKNNVYKVNESSWRIDIWYTMDFEVCDFDSGSCDAVTEFSWISSFDDGSYYSPNDGTSLNAGFTRNKYGDVWHSYRVATIPDTSKYGIAKSILNWGVKDIGPGAGNVGLTIYAICIQPVSAYMNEDAYIEEGTSSDTSSSHIHNCIADEGIHTDKIHNLICDNVVTTSTSETVRNDMFKYSHLPLKFRQDFGRNFLYLKDNWTMTEYTTDNNIYQLIPRDLDTNYTETSSPKFWAVTPVKSRYEKYISQNIPPKFDNEDYESVHRIYTKRINDVYDIEMGESAGSYKDPVTYKIQSAATSVEANLKNNCVASNILYDKNSGFMSSDNLYGDLLYDEPIYTYFSLLNRNGLLYPMHNPESDRDLLESKIGDYREWKYIDNNNNTNQFNADKQNSAIDPFEEPWLEYKWFDKSIINNMPYEDTSRIDNKLVVNISTTDNTEDNLKSLATAAFKEKYANNSMVDEHILDELYNIKYNFIDYDGDVEVEGNINLLLQTDVSKYGMGMFKINYNNSSHVYGKLDNETDVDCKGSIVVYAGCTGIVYKTLVELEPNTHYVYSAKIKTNGNSKWDNFHEWSLGPVHAWLTAYNDGAMIDGHYSWNEGIVIDWRQKPTDEWQTLYFHFKTGQNAIYFRPFIYSGDGSDEAYVLYVKEFKLEKGLKYTDWSPHPYENKSNITYNYEVEFNMK